MLPWVRSVARVKAASRRARSRGRAGTEPAGILSGEITRCPSETRESPEMWTDIGIRCSAAGAMHPQWVTTGIRRRCAARIRAARERGTGSRSGPPDVGIREAHPGGTPRGVPGFDRRAARRVAWTCGRRILSGEIFACHPGKPPIETPVSVGRAGRSGSRGVVAVFEILLRIGLGNRIEGAAVRRVESVERVNRLRAARSGANCDFPEKRQLVQGAPGSNRDSSEGILCQHDGKARGLPE